MITTAQAQFITGVVDRTIYTDSATFTVNTNAGFAYEVMLNDAPVPAGVSRVVNVMDFYELQFEDESFDSALAMSSLLHAPKQHFPLIIDEIYRILKPGGIFYIGMFTGFYDGILPSYGNRYVALYQKDELLDVFGERFAVLNMTRFRPDRTRRYISFILSKNQAA